MTVIAEIADKMPSTLGIIVVCLLLTAISVALASAYRRIAWGVLAVALVGGALFAAVGYHASFLEDAFSDAIWSELGWRWVAATIIGPLLPGTAIRAFMLLRGSLRAHVRS